MSVTDRRVLISVLGAVLVVVVLVLITVPTNLFAPGKYHPPGPPKPGSVPATQRFTGTGLATIKKIAVPYTSTLTWRCPRCTTFAVNSDYDGGRRAIHIEPSFRPSGSLGVAPGTYLTVIVTANGPWTMTVARDA